MSTDTAELITCPVCLEVARHNTERLGMCQNGHYVCESCTTSVSGEKCPTCRDHSLRLKQRDEFFNRLLKIVTSDHVYPCRHRACLRQIRGSREASLHELVCDYRALPCRSCGSEFTQAQFYSRTHRCLTWVDGKPLGQTRLYQFVLFSKDLFDRDSCRPPRLADCAQRGLVEAGTVLLEHTPPPVQPYTFECRPFRQGIVFHLSIHQPTPHILRRDPTFRKTAKLTIVINTEAHYYAANRQMRVCHPDEDPLVVAVTCGVQWDRSECFRWKRYLSQSRPYCFICGRRRGAHVHVSVEV